MDIVTTIIALSLGHIEGNPFGFNVFSFIFIGIQITLLLIVIKSKMYPKVVFFVLLVLIIVHIIVVINNVTVIL